MKKGDTVEFICGPLRFKLRGVYLGYNGQFHIIQRGNVFHIIRG
ncbi:hypothetical protein [Yersinia phage vB_YenM_P744]